MKRMLLAPGVLLLLAAGAPLQPAPAPPAMGGTPPTSVPGEAADATARLPAAPVNLDFEKGELGQMPVGWTMTAASERAGFGADLTDDQPYEGRTCAVVRGIGYSRTPGTGTITQSFDAAAYRGQRVRFQAAVRAEGSRGQLWLAVERPNRLPGFFDNMADRPITSGRWQVYEIAGEVAADATRIAVGLTVNGDGRVWIDAGAFTALGPAEDAPPRPLGARGLTNLLAFARLLGYVRYFHPSDQAAAANWGAFAAAAVAELDPAGPAATAPADGESLAAALQRLFAPLAPTLRVFPVGRRPPALDLGPPAGVPSGELRIVSWLHNGLGFPGSPWPFSSLRVRGEPGQTQPGDLDPRVPFAADLGGGASCLLPLAVWADSAGTLPAAVPASTGGAGDTRDARNARDAQTPPGTAQPVTPKAAKPGTRAPAAAKAASSGSASSPAAPAPATPVAAPVTAADRNSRLAIVILTWNVLQHFHPGLAAGGVARAVAWQKALPAALREAAEGPGIESLLAALRRMLAVTDDGQATIAAAGDLRTYGLPLRWDWIEGRLVVTAVGAGVEGLHPGDAVTRIEGREVRSELQAAEAQTAAATPQWRRWRALASLALGERGEPLRLDVEPAAPANPAAKAMVPHAVTVTHGAPPGEMTPAARAHPDAVREARPGILVVDLSRLAESDLVAALPRLSAAAGIVFDLRGYVRSTDQLLAHLVAVPIDARHETLPTWRRPDREAVRYQPIEAPVVPTAPRLQGRLAFLAGARDVGAAESFLASVAELHLGAIVGSPTGGARGIVDSAPLPAGFTVIWTATRPAAGAPPMTAPVEPTAAVAPTRGGLAAGRDEVLEKALALVTGPAEPAPAGGKG
jgi:hypothetical protein